MDVSVLILTLNEEINLPACLASVKWCDDVVVFDSYSTDGTVDIARVAGARFVQRTFDNYAYQRNAALTEVQYKHPWILMIDADERVPVELHDEIKSAMRNRDPATTLFAMRRKDMFRGKWLRGSSGYPTWFGRLVLLGHISVEREVNEQYYTDGKVGFLKEHLVHYPFRKGIAYWLERHNRYSSMEAAALIGKNEGSIKWKSICSRDPLIRRRTLKQLALRLPGRPLWVFLFLYILRRGFLDGLEGFTYCMLRAMYEYMIDIKVMELRRRKKGLVN